MAGRRIVTDNGAVLHGAGRAVLTGINRAAIRCRYGLVALDQTIADQWVPEAEKTPPPPSSRGVVHDGAILDNNSIVVAYHVESATHTTAITDDGTTCNSVAVFSI